MSKRSHAHTSDEFGKAPSSGSATAGLNGPIIGEAASIMVDALVEEESGKTPSPPPISVGTSVLVFVVMFLLGLTIMALVLWFHIPFMSHPS